MKTKLKFIMIALFTLALTACSTEDGKDGQDGMDGQQGIPGEDGNANVKTYLFKNVSIEIGGNPFVVPAITQNVLDYGAVLGYIRNSGDNKWFSLPYSSPPDQMEISYFYVGNLVIYSKFAITPIDFRFVIIEGSLGKGGKSAEGKSASQAIYDELKTAGVDINNYEEVINYYNSKI